MRRISWSIAFLAAALAVPMTGRLVMAQDEVAAVLQHYRDIQRQHQDDLLAVPGVTGTGVGMSEKTRGVPVIRVYADPGNGTSVSGQVPSNLDGAPVEVVERVPLDAQ